MCRFSFREHLYEPVLDALTSGERVIVVGAKIGISDVALEIEFVGDPVADDQG